MKSPFEVEEKQEIKILREIIYNFLTEHSSPDMWDIEAFPKLKMINDVNKRLSDEEFLLLYQDVKDSLTPLKESKKISIAEVKNHEIIFLKSSDIVSKPIDWLWEGKIAKGKVTLVAGDPGLGKSQTTIFLAGVVSSGGTFPGGNVCKKGKVLLFSAEDDVEDTINPRLQAIEADRDNIFIYSCVTKDGKEKSFDLSKDTELLENIVKVAKDISLIVIDPITAFLGETDSHVNAEVRALLSMLSKMASKYNIAIVVVTHLNKSSGGSAFNKITGSLAFVAAARAAYMVIKDENDEKRRLFLPVKNNLADDNGGFAFKVEGVKIGENIFTSKVVWEKESIKMSASDAMKEQRNNTTRDGVEKKTIEKLEAILRKHPEGMSTDDYVNEAMKIGISRRTLYRAAKDMFIERVGTGKHNTKLWKLVFDENGMIDDDITADALKKFE